MKLTWPKHLVHSLISWRQCDRVVFVEVKTGTSSLTTRERRVRDAVREGRVEWQDLRIADESDDFAPTVPLVIAGPLPYAEEPEQ